MQIIVLQNDLYVKNSNYETFYKGANNLEQPDIKNCYIGGGTELKFIIENLRKHYFSQHPDSGSYIKNYLHSIHSHL